MKSCVLWNNKRSKIRELVPSLYCCMQSQILHGHFLLEWCLRHSKKKMHNHVNHVCLCAYIYTYICVNACIFDMYVYMSVYIFVNVCNVCLYICVYMYMYVYIICMYILYVCMYIYVYIERERQRETERERDLYYRYTSIPKSSFYKIYKYTYNAHQY